MLPNLTLVLGGVASGKSDFAERLAVESGLNRIYLATAQAFDDDMKSKIERHKSSRGSGWTTIEEPVDIEPKFVNASSRDVILLDCATLWLSNLLLAEFDVEARTMALLSALTDCNAPVIIVSNEVGGGGIAATSLARRFANAQGKLNQELAAASDTVITVMAGLPLTLKGKLPEANP
ncbi:bifunctional adenosylcobinamide kinase/adenosylcobinamide-phosphate guanylyltransferase [Halocynthiibacter sp. C4]|uniref:bifunctional adenosylcobinamide kinase/adenosylcobinamide-phosphate guanylyltransferase n=1 Tax=Halocynthiibacter sp. C4 TaxID=2992758 RepID=UPI00237B4646|nr:bifunctional adenosylcobinamide kinase/adenosylcobinamide-phosphate guanylyltransferase [Halocynthiibacter sp. C4]MDE0590343.1 bifunctional adenosylcobinamide kinase/adenosylcobinamide-phosphate guanylyltransferase [Halocynthiibacter sp. C4]